MEPSDQVQSQSSSRSSRLGSRGRYTVRNPALRFTKRTQGGPDLQRRSDQNADNVYGDLRSADGTDRRDRIHVHGNGSAISASDQGVVLPGPSHWTGIPLSK